MISGGRSWFSPTYHAIAGPKSGCEGKTHLRTSLGGDSVGLKTYVPRLRVRYAVLPTKTSLFFIQFKGSPPSLLRACSQVFTTRLVNPSFLLIRVAVILSMVSLSLITRSHRFLISSSECLLSCMTLSHRSTLNDVLLVLPRLGRVGAGRLSMLSSLAPTLHPIRGHF